MSENLRSRLWLGAVALLAGLLIGKTWLLPQPHDGRYQLIVSPARESSQTGIDSIYRIDTRTGRVDWLMPKLSPNARSVIQTWLVEDPQK